MRYFFASWIASLRQSARQTPATIVPRPATGLPDPFFRSRHLVEIAGIDAFSGKPELQHVHLLWTVKHLARKKDFRQQPHPAKRHTQHHGDDHKYACGDKNLGNGGENRRIGDRLVRLVLRYNRLVVHRAVQSCAVRGRRRLQYHGEERGFALDGRPRNGTLLSVVLKPSSTAYGAALHSAVNYETVITQNEPHQTITDPPILTTVAKIFIATGVFMVIAVVLGVAFGGVRLLAKIFFPGKVFDRPEQMDVLQLGLSGKRINSRDFY